MEKKILRLLVADDSPDDTELTANALRKAGYILKIQRVQDIVGMQAALDSGRWDVIISEFSLPNFGAQMALDIVRRKGADTPFIVVTRRISDPDIIRVMRAGAHDVILKNQRAKLVPVIERELRVASERSEYRRANESVKELEDKHQAIVEGSREAICYTHEGMHVDANRTYLNLIGYQNSSELEGVPILNLIEKNDHARFKEFLRKVGKSGEQDQPAEFVVTRKDGARFHAEITVSPINIRGENCLQIIVNDISKRKAVENKLQYLNQRDPLTGLYNRHYFIQELGKAVEKARCGGGDSALIYLDLDQLKKINATLGNAAGDRLLLKLGRLLREHVEENAILCRFSGDEFAILIDNKDEKATQEIADNLRKALKAASFSENGKNYEYRCTLSAVHINKQSGSVQKVLTAANNECEKAKTYKQARPAQEAPRQPEQSAPPAAAPKSAPPESAAVAGWQQRIKQTLEDDSFSLVYQPIINLHGDAGEYYEALVRMHDKENNLISAAEFMPVAEQSGQIKLIDRWVVEHALRALAELHANGKYVYFFINLSTKAFTDENLLPLIRKTLQDISVPAEHVIFETDESVVVNNPADVGVFIREVRKMGCRFAMDNYGNGLGTYNHLRHQPIEFLKIDGALVHNLAGDPINQTVLKAMVEIAKALDKKIIAKYVEDAESLALLWNYGVDYVQGNYLQQAASQLDYDFSGETTLSSEDTQPPSWLSSGGH